MPKNRNEQCRELGYNAACAVREDSRICQILTCSRRRYNKRTHIVDDINCPLILRYGVPDYTECGQSKICMNGQCVEATGPMPQYQSAIIYVPCKKKHILVNEPVMTRREQCQQFGFDVECSARQGFISPSCSSLECGYEQADGIYVKRAPKNTPIPLLPMNGSRCGHNGVCLNRRCIPLQELLLTRRRPTYTGSEHSEICCPEPEN